ncbi:MAG: hypothetical protein EU532_10175 [Promethearchaeota archaeon]|nr:MAG: hypothetical protein EU532_10175 [Candidatus Lokiarchaeota archaeon]
MRKKDKKSKKKSKELDDTNKNYNLKVDIVTFLSKVDELKFSAQRCLMEGNLDDAIHNAEKIIRLAILADKPSYIKEQEEFINSIAKDVQKDFLISEIEKTSKSIYKMYDKLLESNQITQAHEIVESFKHRYSDMLFFDTIKSVNDLISRDNKIWIQYISNLDKET